MSESGRNIPKNFNNNKNLKLFFPYRILQHNTEQIRIIALWKKLMLYDTSHWVLITQILECPFISPTSHRLFCLLRNSPIVECCVYAVYILSVITAKHLCAITSGYPNYFIVLPAYFGVDPSIARFKAWICGLSLARTVGSNPAECMVVCLLWVWCTRRWRSLRRVIAHPEESYRLFVVCVECDPRPRNWGDLGALAQLSRDKNIATAGPS